MPPHLYLLVLAWSLLLAINCQLNVCNNPGTQYPAFTFYNEPTIEVRDDLNQMVFSISQELTSIPRIVLSKPLNLSEQPFTSAFAVLSTELYKFTNNMTVLSTLFISPTNEPVTNYFNFSTNKFNVIASTRTNDTIILVVNSTDTGSVTNAMFDLAKINGIFQLRNQSTPYVTFNITDITAINVKYEQYVVFLGAFWTTVSANQLTQLTTIDFYTSNQLRLSSTWVGCEANFCFEGDLDAASANGDGRIFFFRGNYYWLFNSMSNSIVLPTAVRAGTVDIFNVDAAFSLNSVLYYAKQDTIFGNGQDNKTNSVIAYNKPTGQTFRGFNGQIDAIFIIDKTTYLLSGETYSSYVLDSSSNMAGTVNESNISIASKWPGISGDLDAAVELSGGKELLLFKGSYHYSAQVDGGSVTAQLNMNTLYQCEDTVYVNLSESIGIKDFSEYAVYIAKFRPTPIAIAPITIPPQVEVVPDKTEIVGKSSFKTVIIVVCIVIALIIFIGILIIMTRRKPDPTLEIAFEPDSSMLSTETMATTALNNNLGSVAPTMEEPTICTIKSVA